MPTGDNTTQYINQNPNTGTSADILTRVKALIPNRWFTYVAPLRDAVLGGLSDSAAWCYQWVAYAVQQSRLATSTGPFLDIIAYDFFQRNLLRNGSNDAAFLARIKALLFQERVTRAGMVNVLTTLTGKAPIIFEPWNTGDTGAYGIAMAYAGFNPGFANGGGYGVALGYGDNAGDFYVAGNSTEQASGGAGAYGSLLLPAQVFITAFRPGLQGIPGVDGYGGSIGGYGGGAIEYTSPDMITGAVTDADIYNAVTLTKPTGTVAWTRLQ
jgi:hypothetical protein